MASASVGWVVDCKIGKNKIDVGAHITRFEWQSMINGGYIARVKVIDPYFKFLDKVIEGDGSFLETGRQADNLTLVEFQLKWASKPPTETRKTIALISTLHATGADSMAGVFEFIAVDPISYFMNSGDCSGTAYTGKIGGEDGVISQVFNDYVPKNIGGYKTKLKVSETDDNENTYWMMRQDPKTFLASILEWSSSFTKHKTSWLVSNGQDEAEKTITLNIEESYTPSLEYPTDKSPMILVYGGGGTPNIDKWELLADNFLSALNLKLLTSGLSASSGEYFDRITDKDEEQVYIKDENTNNKVNPNITDQHGFTKPKSENGATTGTGSSRPSSKRGWTHIISTPEVYSAGDIGFKHSRYIDGRARQKYIEMLNLLMRIRVTVTGDPRLYDSTELGRTKATLRWMKPDEKSGGSKPRFLDGDWLIYGWHHKLVGGDWTTDMYLARLDWDAASVG